MLVPCYNLPKPFRLFKLTTTESLQAYLLFIRNKSRGSVLLTLFSHIFNKKSSPTCKYCQIFVAVQPKAEPLQILAAVRPSVSLPQIFITLLSGIRYSHLTLSESARILTRFSSTF